VIFGSKNNIATKEGRGCLYGFIELIFGSQLKGVAWLNYIYRSPYFGKIDMSSGIYGRRIKLPPEFFTPDDFTGHGIDTGKRSALVNHINTPIHNNRRGNLRDVIFRLPFQVRQGDIALPFSGIAIALMTIPNLFGILMLHKEMKSEVKSFWLEYAERFPGEKVPKG